MLKKLTDEQLQEKKLLEKKKRAEYHKKYYATHPEQRQKFLQWQKDNPDKVAARAKRAYNKDPEKFRERSRQFAKNHPERYQEILSKSYTKNKEKYLAKRKIWYQENKEMVLSIHRNWYMQVKNLPEFRIKMRLSSRKHYWANRDKILENAKSYYKKNEERLKEYNKNRPAEKRKAAAKKHYDKVKSDPIAYAKLKAYQKEYRLKQLSKIL